MAKKKQKRYYRKPNMAYNPNIYDIGGFINGVASGKGLGSLGKGAAGSLLGAASNVVGGAVSTALSGGMTSSAGNVIGGLSSIASAIPGPWGAIASTGLKVVGGLTNKAFGSKLNAENINNVNNTIGSMNNYTSDASSFDALQSNIQSEPMSMDFNRKYIGKDGWFSTKAKRKYNELKANQATAQQFVDRSTDNNLDNLYTNQEQGLAATYSAYGGPLGGKDYDFSDPYLVYANGGNMDININPKNIGKFNATKARLNKTTEELTHSNNPTTKARAIFAQNAAGWKHAFGGNLMTNGSDWDNGVTIINNGGSHEQNPNEGVQLGVDKQGAPNLVEEGEVVYNDYVYSRRIVVPKSMKTILGIKDDRITFADAAKNIQKLTEDRPNDPISERTMKANMRRLQVAQDIIKNKRDLNNNQNPTSDQGNQEVPMQQPIQESQNPQQQEQPTDNQQMQGQETPQDPSQMYAKGGNLSLSDTPISDIFNNNLFKSTTDTNLGFNIPKTLSTNTQPYSGPSQSIGAGLRFAPAIGSGIGAFTDLMGYTNKPDYSSADLIMKAGDSLKDARYTPLGNKLSYTPLDRLFYSNIFNANAAGTRKAITSQAGLNRGQAIAGLLASDYNTGSSMGQLFRQGDEYNQQQKERVATFNRATDMQNQSSDIQVQGMNMQKDQSKLGLYSEAARLRENATNRSSAARSANLTNFFNSMGDIGREAYTMDMIKNNPALLYDWSGKYKGNKSAFGGKLNKKFPKRK